jgi:hypothetical protein
MDKPTKITFEHYDEKITIEKDHSDLTADEIREMLISLVRASGYNMHLDIIFGEEFGELE